MNVETLSLRTLVWASNLQGGTICVWPRLLSGPFDLQGCGRMAHPALWPPGTLVQVKRKISLQGSVKYHIIVSVHLGIWGSSKGQPPSLWHGERPPVWREALRRFPPCAPPAVAGGVWQYAAGPGEIPALFRSRRGHAGERWWPPSSSKGELVDWTENIQLRLSTKLYLCSVFICVDVCLFCVS